jgi:hypothetical protein
MAWSPFGEGKINVGTGHSVNAVRHGRGRGPNRRRFMHSNDWLAGKLPKRSCVPPHVSYWHFSEISRGKHNRPQKLRCSEKEPGKQK